MLTLPPQDVMVWLVHAIVDMRTEMMVMMVAMMMKMMTSIWRLSDQYHHHQQQQHHHHLITRTATPQAAFISTAREPCALLWRLMYPRCCSEQGW